MLTGTAPAEAHAAGAPKMPSLDTEPVVLEGVEVFQLLCEIENDVACELLPPALHPTNPAIVSWLVYVCPDSPWGAFRLAQTRIECRSGTRPRGFLVSGVIDNAEARTALAERWGYRLLDGTVDYRRGYDGVDVEVSRGDEPILEIGMREPTLLPPEVVQFVSSVHPAHTPAGYRLVQVDPVHAVTRAERGQPIVDDFEGAEWGDELVLPHYPVSAALCLADVTLPRLRFMCRPGELAFSGSERIG